MTGPDNCNASDGEDQGEWTQIPGVDAPSREAAVAFCFRPPEASDAVAENNGRLVWDYHVRGVLADYPQIGVAGSAANRRFGDLFRVLGGRLEDLRPVAELVMIYPPRELSAVESDGASGADGAGED